MPRILWLNALQSCYAEVGGAMQEKVLIFGKDT